MSGTTRTSTIGFLGYDEEASFAAVSSAYDKVLQVRDVTLNPGSLVQPMIERGGVFSYMGDSEFAVQGAFLGGTLSFEMDLYGHGTTTAGALSETPLARLLGHVFGNSDATQVGGSATSTTDTDTLTSTNTTLLEGGLIRIGVLGDAKAEGQGTVLADATNSYELMVAMPGTVTSGDAVYATQLIYPDVTNSNNHLTSTEAIFNNTLRFVVATGNQQWVCRGCACTSIELSGFNAGEIPKAKMTWTVAYWDDISVTFPSATASADFAPAPVANGSFFYNTVGTTTRQTEPVRNVSFSIDHGMVPIIGQGGANTSQVIVGYVRTRSVPRLNFSVEAQAATATPAWGTWWEASPNTNTYRHILYTMSITDGRTVMLYMPRCRPIGNRMTQSDIEGLNYVPVSVEGRIGATTTNALTLSPWRIGLG